MVESNGPSFYRKVDKILSERMIKQVGVTDDQYFVDSIILFSRLKLMDCIKVLYYSFFYSKDNRMMNATEITRKQKKNLTNERNCGELERKIRIFSQKIELIRVTKKFRQLHIDLLVIENQERDDDFEHHFVTVKSFNR